MSTGLVAYENNQPTFDLVRDGVRGNLDVVYRMIDLVRNTDVLDKGFETFVKQTEVANDLDSYSDTEETFRFWFDYVKEHVKYIRDIAGRIESIKDARTTIEDGFGDCDDLAILNASILSVLGFQPVFVIAKYPSASTYTHVYTACYVNGVRYVFDPVIPDGEFNQEAEGLQTEEIPIFQEHPAVDGLLGLVRNAKYMALETKDNIKDAIPLITSFLPLGFAARTAFRGLFSGVDTQSLSELASGISSQLTDLTIKLQNGLIAQDSASSQAHQIYAQLYSYAGDKETDQFKELNKILSNKVNYIDTFSGYGVIPVLTTNAPLKTYLIYGAIGFGVYMLLKD